MGRACPVGRATSSLTKQSACEMQRWTRINVLTGTDLEQASVRTGPERTLTTLTLALSFISLVEASDTNPMTGRDRIRPTGPFHHSESGAIWMNPPRHR